MEQVVDRRKISHQAWLQYRKSGIGGSDAGAILVLFIFPQIIMSSAFRAPACFNASRIATRSLGDAPTAFTASTMLDS